MSWIILLATLAASFVLSTNGSVAEVSWGYSFFSTVGLIRNIVCSGDTSIPFGEWMGVNPVSDDMGGKSIGIGCTCWLSRIAWALPGGLIWGSGVCKVMFRLGGSSDSRGLAARWEIGELAGVVGPWWEATYSLNGIVGGEPSIVSVLLRSSLSGLCTSAAKIKILVIDLTFDLRIFYPVPNRRGVRSWQWRKSQENQL